MLTLTPGATQAIEQILENPGLPEEAGVRISATPEPSGNGTAPQAIELQMDAALDVEQVEFRLGDQAWASKPRVGR